MNFLLKMCVKGLHVFVWVKGFPVMAICLVGVDGVAKLVTLGKYPVAFHLPDVVLMRLKSRHVETRNPLQFCLGFLNHGEHELVVSISGIGKDDLAAGLVTAYRFGQGSQQYDRFVRAGEIIQHQVRKTVTRIQMFPGPCFGAYSGLIVRADPRWGPGGFLLAVKGHVVDTQSHMIRRRARELGVTLVAASATALDSALGGLDAGPSRFSDVPALLAPGDGHLAAEHAAASPSTDPGTGHGAPAASSDRPADFRKLKKEIRETAWDYAGISRSESGMHEGLRRLKGLAAQIESAAADSMPEKKKRFDLSCAAVVLKAILVAGLDRKESRGAFFREDFPETDNASWRKNSCQAYDPESGDFKLDYHPVPGSDV